MSDIFISYARENRPRAEAIAKALEAQGWSVWWDRNIRAGEAFRRVIREEIKKARSVVVLWSEQSVESDWVIEEATLAKKRNVLIPVLTTDVELPLGFGQIHTADLTGWDGDATAPAFRMLCSDIERLTGAPANVATAAQGQPTSPALPQSSVQINPQDGLSYVWIPPGEFWMGATPGDTDAEADEKPRHRVRITKGCWAGETPVTVAAYKLFALETSRTMPPAPDFNPEWSKDDHPVVRVSWDEAAAYCEWAGGRLPTEAEWEHAARSGKDGLKYPWGNDITPENANYSKRKWKGTSPVRSYPANAWGLSDMAGNIWEWVADRYDEDYYATITLNAPVEDPRGPDRQTGVRVLRGGSFDDVSRDLRVSGRVRLKPGPGVNSIGFRCVREAVP